MIVLCPTSAVITAREAGWSKTGYCGTTHGSRTETPQLGLWLDSANLIAAAIVEDYMFMNLNAARVHGTDTA